MPLAPTTTATMQGRHSAASAPIPTDDEFLAMITGRATARPRLSSRHSSVLGTRGRSSTYELAGAEEEEEEEEEEGREDDEEELEELEELEEEETSAAHGEFVCYGDRVCLLCEGQLLALTRKFNLSYEQMALLALSTIATGGLLGIASLLVWKRGLFRKRYAALLPDLIYEGYDNSALGEGVAVTLGEEEEEGEEARRQRRGTDDLDPTYRRATYASSLYGTTMTVDGDDDDREDTSSATAMLAEDKSRHEAEKRRKRTSRRARAVTFRIFAYDRVARAIDYASIGQPVRLEMPVVLVHAASRRAIRYKSHRGAVTISRPLRNPHFQKQVRQGLDAIDEQAEAAAAAFHRGEAEEGEEGEEEEERGHAGGRRRQRRPHSHSLSALRLSSLFSRASSRDDRRTGTNQTAMLVEASSSFSSSSPLRGDGGGADRTGARAAVARAHSMHPASTTRTTRDRASAQMAPSVSRSHRALPPRRLSLDAASSGPHSSPPLAVRRSLLSVPSSFTPTASGPQTKTGPSSPTPTPALPPPLRHPPPPAQDRKRSLFRSLSTSCLGIVQRSTDAGQARKQQQELSRRRRLLEIPKQLPNMWFPTQDTPDSSYFVAHLRLARTQLASSNGSSNLLPGDAEDQCLRWGAPLQVVAEHNGKPCGFRSREYYRDSQRYLTTDARAATTLIALPESGNLQAIAKESIRRLAHLEQRQVSLRIGTYNVWMMPRKLSAFTGISPHKNTRAKLIPEVLPVCDVWVFTECFDHRGRDVLLDKLKAQGYGFDSPTVGHKQQCPGDGRYVRKMLNGGVVLVSKYPILSVRIKLFNDVCAGSDKFADKGVLYCKILKHGLLVHVFSTHLQAWNDPLSRSVRRTQLEIVARMQRAMGIDPKVEAVVYTGDLNVNMWLNRENGEYDEMLEILDARDPSVTSRGLRSEGGARGGAEEGTWGGTLGPSFPMRTRVRGSTATTTASGETSGPLGSSDAEELSREEEEEEEERRNMKLKMKMQGQGQGQGERSVLEYKRGALYSFDPRVNPLAGNGLSSDGSLELLDFVLVSRGHRQPSRAVSWVQPIVAPSPWVWKKEPHYHLSDHFPVVSDLTFDMWREQ